MTTRTTALLGSEPLALATVKNHLKVDYTTDDDLITALITVAREHCESYTQHLIAYQRREMVLDRFPASWTRNEYAEIQLAGPVIAVESITYLDQDGDTTTYGAANYRVKTEPLPGRIAPVLNWPTDSQPDPAGVKITYTGGYADTADVPKVFTQAMLLMIGDWYENRSDQARNLPTASKRLLDLVRVQTFFNNA